jgi:uncharacterized membrane protein YeiB
MKQRIIGFDLARAYAIFGMYIVNFNIVFGDYHDQTVMGRFLSLFSGNSSTIFVLLAGMGVSLMSNRKTYSAGEQKQLQKVISKRSWFLFAVGMLLYPWWPADILHFYGAYMHIAVLLLFANRRWYLFAAAAAVIVFHVLLLLIPYKTGWDFETLQYKDFWTVQGFLRNTFYNGWNPVFPWLAYFMLGMYMGRLNWQDPFTWKKTFLTGFAIYFFVVALQLLSNYINVSGDLHFYINADYIPPFLPFLLSTSGFGVMMIAALMYIGQKTAGSKFVQSLSLMGKMTLTHYISHLTIGILLFVMITGKGYTGQLNKEAPVSPVAVLLYSTVYFVFSYFFSKYWLGKFKNGPFEIIMRKLSD